MRFKAGKHRQNFFKIIQSLNPFRGLVVAIDDPANLSIGALLPASQRIKLCLRNDDLFVRPAHRNELADERHLQLAVHLLPQLPGWMLVEPMRQRIDEREIAIHVLVLDQRSTHDDLWNEHKRNDVRRRFRIGHERRDHQTQGHAAHRRHEDDAQIDPEHSANLQDVIADQDEQEALDECENTEGDRF